jgi:hypothetical protein
MKLASEIDNRTAHYPLSGSAYSEPAIREAWWMETAALLQDDPMAVGAAQQSVEEGQYFAYIQSRLKDPDTLGMMRNVDEWEKVSQLPQSPRRLPMTPGQPDFAFADEENAVLALKHGETCLFINFYYRAERGVNRVARVFELDAQTSPGSPPSARMWKSSAAAKPMSVRIGSMGFETWVTRLPVRRFIRHGPET